MFVPGRVEGAAMWFCLRGIYVIAPRRCTRLGRRAHILLLQGDYANALILKEGVTGLIW